MKYDSHLRGGEYVLTRTLQKNLKRNVYLVLLPHKTSSCFLAFLDPNDGCTGTKHQYIQCLRSFKIENHFNNSYPVSSLHSMSDVHRRRGFHVFSWMTVEDVELVAGGNKRLPPVRQSNHSPYIRYYISSRITTKYDNLDNEN